MQPLSVIECGAALAAVVNAHCSAVLGYVGPGTGLSAFGALIALIVAILLAILGFVWYPAKRLIRWLRRPGDADEDGRS